MTDKPKIPGAPGSIWRKTAKGWECRWQARTSLIKRKYELKSLKLWSGRLEEIDEATIRHIQDRATTLQTEMLVWARGGIEKAIPAVYDGTLATLARCYQTDRDSPYHKTRYVSRVYYDKLIKRLTEDHGDEPVKEIRARQVLRWHEEWSDGGKVAMAHSLIGMLRTVINFGVTMLEDPECQRVSLALNKLRFKMAKPRSARLTADQANLIRKKAREKGFPSIALAQALQFECMLRQKDVIGEWVPINEPGLSEVVHNGQKWLRGTRWEEIDHELVLKHITSKRQKPMEAPLASAPMVLDELKLIGALPDTGPIIVCEATGLPWTASSFRKTWRELATECGIPKSVRNMDSRAGAITEATDAGADLEHVRHAATHSDIGMTQRYSRGDAEKTANVMRKRMEFRANKKGTDRA